MMQQTPQRIYLDHAATTPARPEVVEAMLPYLTRYGYNPSSLHGEGRKARAAVDGARETVGGSIGARSKEIVFTGGGSEADNLAILGVARALRARGKHIVTSTIEHQAVLQAVDLLKEEGWEVTALDTGAGGTVDPAQFADALRADTTLATIMFANNEIGTLAPIESLANIARARGVLFHTDAVQAPAYVALDVRRLGVDLLSLSAHKFYGPKGVGALYLREGTPMAPLIVGGSQEFAKRAGTENVAGIVGMAKALELAVSELPQAAVRVAALRDRLEDGIVRQIPDVRVNGKGSPRLANNCNVSFAGVDGEALLIGLDLEGIAVSTGSACASGSSRPSHVIAALGLADEWSRGVVRFSLGRETTRAQIDRALEVLSTVIARLRGVSSM